MSVQTLDEWRADVRFVVEDQFGKRLTGEAWMSRYVRQRLRELHAQHAPVGLAAEEVKTVVRTRDALEQARRRWRRSVEFRERQLPLFSAEEDG